MFRDKCVMHEGQKISESKKSRLDKSKRLKFTLAYAGGGDLRE
jgi:hypothetical protein